MIKYLAVQRLIQLRFDDKSFCCKNSIHSYIWFVLQYSIFCITLVKKTHRPCKGQYRIIYALLPRANIKLVFGSLILESNTAHCLFAVCNFLISWNWLKQMKLRYLICCQHLRQLTVMSPFPKKRIGLARSRGFCNFKL